MSTVEIVDQAMQREIERQETVKIEQLEKAIEYEKELQHVKATKSLEREAEKTRLSGEISRRAYLLYRIAEEKRLTRKSEEMLVKMQLEDKEKEAQRLQLQSKPKTVKAVWGNSKTNNSKTLTVNFPKDFLTSNNETPITVLIPTTFSQLKQISDTTTQHIKLVGVSKE